MKQMFSSVSEICSKINQLGNRIIFLDLIIRSCEMGLFLSIFMNLINYS